ncbi:GL25759 [Drosophila persimilis]|uniref:GL25759 n=1 Tax=Drosophila persimilis TaxID=7234 RepID=B4GK21_DROPE|nr:GL25759 [Drosophila persimilis]
MNWLITLFVVAVIIAFIYGEDLQKVLGMYSAPVGRISELNEGLLESSLDTRSFEEAPALKYQRCGIRLQYLKGHRYSSST